MATEQTSQPSQDQALEDTMQSVIDGQEDDGTVSPDDTIDDGAGGDDSAAASVEDEPDDAEGEGADPDEAGLEGDGLKTATEELAEEPKPDEQSEIEAWNRDIQAVSALKLTDQERFQLSTMDAGQRRRAINFLIASRTNAPEVNGDDSRESDDERIAAIAAKLMPSDSVLAEIAKDEGLGAESIKRLMSEMAAKSASLLDETHQRLRKFEAERTRTHRDVVNREVTTAIGEAKATLTKELPFLTDDKFKALLDDKAVNAIYEQEYERTGNRREAVRSALRQGAIARFEADYANHIRRSERGRLNATSNSRKATSDRAGGHGAVKPGKAVDPSNLDAVMDSILEEAG